MLNAQWVYGKDGEDFDYFDMASWHEMCNCGAVSPDDGTGYPAIKTTKGKFMKMLGHSVWPVNQEFDGVIWYNK